MGIVILIQLLLAHLVTDFIIQPDTWVAGKKEKGLRSIHYWLHVFLSGLLTYLFLMQWTNWIIPLFVLITHGSIDLWKIRKEKIYDKNNAGIENKSLKRYGSKYFFIDQLLHLSVVIVAWLYVTKSFDRIPGFVVDFLSDKSKITILTALVIIIWPAGKLIDKITEPLRSGISNEDSLKNAGAYIGVLERILVFVFILFNQYAAIGFLMAGKSILRVSRDTDQDARKKTEYVLIGTLLSFTVAIGIGLLAQHVVR